MRGYVNNSKMKDVDKDKNYKLIPFRIDDGKLLEKCKTIWTKIETLNSLPVHSNRYIKTKVRTHGDKFYNNYRGLIVSEYDAKCKPHNYFCWFIPCLWKQILPSSTSRQ